MIEYLAPTAEPGVPIEPYEGWTAWAPGTTVGLLANSFPGSVAFLARVGRALEGRVPGLQYRSFDKGRTSGSSVPLTPDRVAGITRECEVVVTAYGH